MSLSMHSASVPVFTRMFGNLNQWLDKAEAHALARKFDANVFLATRLAPDMLPFSSQIQIACDGPKIGIARLSGVEAPKFEDNETTIAQLRERIAKTLAFIQSVPAERINGTEDKTITFPRRAGEVSLKGDVYLRQFMLPNFYFHVTTAYALLRHGGVELGKSDYLGALTS